MRSKKKQTLALGPWTMTPIGLFLTSFYFDGGHCGHRGKTMFARELTGQTDAWVGSPGGLTLG